MLVPYDADKMEAYTIDRSISKLGFNTSYPEVLNEKEYKDLLPLVKIN